MLLNTLSLSGMHAKVLSRFLKILISLFITVVIIITIGRNHFFLGTTLILFRWILFILGLFFLYLTFKRTASFFFKAGILFALSLILIEHLWNKSQEKNLTEGKLTTEISIMTYNLFFKNPYSYASLENIKNCNPDILILQELTPEMKTKIENMLGAQYPYKKTTALKGTHGMGVYSRFPISKSELLNNSRKRPYAEILELTIHHKKVQLFNVHLSSPAMAVEHPENFISFYNSNYEVREKQLEAINTIAVQKENEFDVQLLVGDLNTTPFEPIYRNLEYHWVNLYSKAGTDWGLTFPNSKNHGPLITIDYILAKGTIKGIEMKVIKGGGSDHLAIAGKIKL